MERIEKTIEVECPVRVVYNQWTQFEEFPEFMTGVKEVRQIDDTHLHWCAEIWGKDKEWDAEITEQVPDERISWRSTDGSFNAGTVRFESLGPNRTNVRLTMAYDPEGAVENIGDAVGIFSSRVQNTVEDFKEFIEGRAEETGEWRGEVHGGQARKPGDTPTRASSRKAPVGGGSGTAGSRGTQATGGAGYTNTKPVTSKDPNQC
ncbi:MAG TPA: SRPBCC family protein [Burkholderiales bacterium]|nr:SRPBCC family protein [Burkholderiales bacterium]